MKLCRVNVRLPGAEAARLSKPYQESGRQETNAAEYRTQLGFPIVEFIRPQFPDAAVFEQTGKGYKRKYIEFEYMSQGYKVHLTSKRKCHYVVCWEHNWKECPIPVIELKAEIPKILFKKGGVA